LSLEEREEVLNKYHPDYQKEGRRAVKVGPNKGDLFQEEVADLLESKSMVRPKNADLSTVDYETDVLIIGGGGAATSAALMASEKDVKVIMATKLTITIWTPWVEGILPISRTWSRPWPTMHLCPSPGWKNWA
jgi:hypothetical protein